MMNQGGIADTVTTLDPNSLERHAVDSSQGQASSYYPSSTGSEALSWTMYRGVNGSSENRVYSNSSFNHEQHVEPSSRNLQDGLTVQSATSTSSSGTANVSQDYSSYATYSSSDPYGYASTGYTGYYNGYQQQPNQSYPQPVGGYQSTGAPHQPISSFQNTGSYAGSSSYSTTYYNPGDYQTSGSYTSGAYSNQTNLWHQGGYSSYTQQYPSYTPQDSNSAYSSSNAPTTSVQYEQQYKQWADYYSQTEVSCAPGTENISVASTSSLGGPGPGVASGYSAANSQQPASVAPSSWRPESSSSELPLVQPSALTSEARDSYWKYGGQGVQNYHVSSLQQNLQKPLDLNPTLGSFQDQQKSEFHQGSNVQYQTVQQVVPSYQSSYHASLQTAPPTVTQIAPQIPQTVASKVQIPTNPRIASNLPLGFSKTDKDSTMSGMTKVMKPAYVSVSLPKPNDKESSHVAADSILKPGMFPRSLRGYVERALARCKDDTQMAACQAVMKEVITKATADGTLCTRDWDSEPLFPLPNMDSINKESNLDSSTPVSALVKNRRSPSRRTKSRWEPLPEEKPIEKQSPFTPDNIRYGGGVHPSEKEKQFSSGKPENKENKFSNLKFYLSNQKSANKNVLRPAKRQRLGEDLGGGSNGDSSSDSDKEQSLTEYYAGAITLADSPEERKRRESRSKRFEKNHGNRAANNLMRPKNLGAGNLYTRRATALVLSQNFEDGASRAVEDIDWDSLTVKGTCQEIEKRYLRLTSAPDPATVRPEEVLEKSLQMVQNSQKNYFYKCDQLKSIRQDLTVQRIRNELTAKVYETHARLAIEVGDLSEYNQCQSQLTTLYAEGIKGCHMEFSAYNLLCVILHSNNNRDLLSAMSRLSAEARKDEAVKHALAVRAAVTAGNYVLFFKLYKTGPNLNTCLMDLYVEKMRYAAVKCMSRSYRPTIPVPYIAQVLGFTTTYPMAEAPEEKDTDGLEECMEWLKAHGACVVADSSGEMMVDAKASMSSLFMPEPEDAVAHGDASLAVNDFLTRTPT